MAAQGKHHGGAWKVAYADFVTAMMALFMVLWLTSQNEELKKDLAKFFQDPYNTPMSESMGVLGDSGNPESPETDKGADKGKANISDMKVLYAMAQEFMRLLNIDTASLDERLDLNVTSDGLRVTLYDRDAHPFFVENTAEFTDWGKFVIETMAWLVQRHSFKVRVDGYVSEGYEGKGIEYSAWELSSDRANSTRRYLEFYGVASGQFQGVTAYGNSRPLDGTHPADESNDRVAISLVLNENFNPLDAFEQGE